ncbi:MAG TPA: ABC transporter ATP-binding protein [Xanthobacteraceae bacterium]|nr:ABC transporter ATP-binding protein [Xanthobacteraceae bacterium]
MTKPDLSKTNLAKQTIAFVRDFAGFAGLSGVWAATLSAIAAAFEGVGIVLLIPILSIVTASDSDTGRIHQIAIEVLGALGAQTRTSRLSALLGLFAVLVVVRALLLTRRNMTLGKLQAEFSEMTQGRLAERLGAAPWPVVSRLQHARVTHLMSGDINRIGAAAYYMVQFATTAVVIVSQIVLAFLLAPLLTFISLLLIAAGAACGFMMLRRAHDFGAEFGRMNTALTHEMTQFLGGLKLAAGQNRQANFVAEFQTSLAELTQRSLAFIRQENRNRLAVSLISGLTGALIAFVGLALFDLQAPVILTMLFIFSRISGPAVQLSESLQQFATSVPAHAEAQRLERDLAAACASADQTAASTIAPGAIVFRDVSFHYERSAGGVERLSLTIAPGTVLGVSGPTGAGKTTFADLLIGLLKPDAGEITVGDTPLRGAAATAWRDHIGYVVQDPYLFRDTVRRNLLWAKPQASEAEIWDAVAVAGVDQFVAGLELGLETVLGERGTLISGGERRRLCLARAVLRRRWLFVLDEATSAIDVATEGKILKRIVNLNPRPTIVMIAHRDQTLAYCDRMLRFRNGTFVAGEDALAAQPAG